MISFIMGCFYNAYLIEALDYLMNVVYNMSLDTFINRSRPIPKPVCTSRSIQDRGSVFLATLFHVTSPTEAMAATKYLKNVIHNDKPADHEMMAYRVMTLKSGKSGLDGPNDFELQGKLKVG